MTDIELLEARILVAGFFKKRRKDLKISQQELADKTGSTLNAIERFEQGKFWPLLRHFIVWCDALEIDLVELLRRELDKAK